MEMINERKFSDAKDKKRDVFLNLVNVNEELPGNAERKLWEAELIGTISVFCLRPHLFTCLRFSTSLDMKQG